jgi:predicted lipoprotein with Yx(FWY)xxD motif
MSMGADRPTHATDEQGQLVKHRGQLAGSVLLSAGLVMAAASTPALAAGHHKGTKIATRHIKLGTVLASSKGRVIYLFEQDTKGVSHCTGGCAAAWPRVTSTAKPVAGTGISAAHLSRAAKHHQVTYYGHPLYYFSGDSAPGQATGEGVNSFFVVSTHGAAIKPKPVMNPAGPSGPAEVSTGMVGAADVITSADGHTVYELSSETDSPPSFTCTGQCTTVWPPLLTKGAPTASGDAMASELGTVMRPDGLTQVTYNHHPLYDYSGDAAAGTDKGEGLYDAPGYWYSLTPAGAVN